MASPNSAENEYFAFNPFIANFYNTTAGGISPSSGTIMYLPAKDENNVKTFSNEYKPLEFIDQSDVYASFSWKYLFSNTHLNAVNNFQVSADNVYLYLTTYNEDLVLCTSIRAGTNPLAQVALVKTETGQYMPMSANMNGWTFIFQNYTTAEVTYINGAYFQPELTEPSFDVFVGAYKLGQSQGSAWDPYGDQQYQNGYDNGKRDGIAEANGTLNGFEVIGQAFEGVGGFLSKELLPGISIGTLISVPILVTLIAVVIRILKK